MIIMKINKHKLVFYHEYNAENKPSKESSGVDKMTLSSASEEEYESLDIVFFSLKNVEHSEKKRCKL